MAVPELRLVLVTPETTVLDEPVQSLQFPLFDGMIGILPGRAPLVGRLGHGELRVAAAGGTRRFFIDGGFVQVKQGVVTLLTNRALEPHQIDAAGARAALQESIVRKTTSDADSDTRFRDQERARRLLAVAAH